MAGGPGGLLFLWGVMTFSVHALNFSGKEKQKSFPLKSILVLATLPLEIVVILKFGL